MVSGWDFSPQNCGCSETQRNICDIRVFFNVAKSCVGIIPVFENICGCTWKNMHQNVISDFGDFKKLRFLLFFCLLLVWGLLALAKQPLYHLSHTSVHFVLVILEMGVL
jgi:hypothetical membrane protein